MRDIPGFHAAAWISLSVWALSGAADAALPVRVLGNRFFSDRKIRNVLPRPPGRISSFDLRSWEEEASRRMRALYRSEGFLDAEARVEVGPVPDRPEGFAAVATVDEGPRYSVDAVSIVSAGGGELPVTMPDPDLEPGEPLRYRILAVDLRRILEALAARGYLYAKAQEEVSARPDLRLAEVRYVVDPGPAAVFDSLRIVVRRLAGPRLADRGGAGRDTIRGRTRSGILRSLSPYRPGDTITSGGNRLYLRKLAATGVFASLAAEAEPLPGGGSALVLRALEDDAIKLKGSASFSPDFGAGGGFSVRDGNLAGTLKGLGAEFQAAQVRQEIRLDYSSALVFGALLDFNAGLSTAWYQGDPLHRALGEGAFAGDFQSAGTAGFGRDLTARLSLSEDGEVLFRSRLTAPGRRTRGLFLNLIQGIRKPSGWRRRGIPWRFAGNRACNRPTCWLRRRPPCTLSPSWSRIRMEPCAIFNLWPWPSFRIRGRSGRRGTASKRKDREPPSRSGRGCVIPFPASN